jgi:hypothetical protein
VGGVVVALAIAGGVYYQRSRRQSEAPHLPTSYKQKQAMQKQRRDRSDSYYSDEDEVRCVPSRCAPLWLPLINWPYGACRGPPSAFALHRTNARRATNMALLAYAERVQGPWR